MSEPRALTEAFAWTEAKRLRAFGNFPDGHDAVAEVAGLLLAWCKGGMHAGKLITAEDQCRMFMNEAVMGLDWRGPHQLREIFDDLFPEEPVPEGLRTVSEIKASLTVPSGEHQGKLVDDLSADDLKRLAEDKTFPRGFRITAWQALHRKS